MKTYAHNQGAKVITVSAKIESEIAELNESEKKDFLEELGIDNTGLDKLIRASYDLLELIVFLKAREQEVRA